MAIFLLMVHSVSGKYLEHHLAMLLRIRILKVLMCYYHVTENIRKKCKPYISNREDVYDELKAYL